MRTKATTEADRASAVVPAIEPRAPWRVQDIRVLEHGMLEVHFVDGTGGIADMREFLSGESAMGTLFEPLRDPAVFSQATVHLGAVQWPGQVDVAPDAMYDAIRAEGTWTLR